MSDLPSSDQYHGKPKRSLLCFFNRHEPPGKRASWDGLAFVSRCQRCHKPIRRISKGKWREDAG